MVEVWLGSKVLGRPSMCAWFGEKAGWMWCAQGKQGMLVGKLHRPSRARQVCLAELTCSAGLLGSSSVGVRLGRDLSLAKLGSSTGKLCSLSAAWMQVSWVGLDVSRLGQACS